MSEDILKPLLAALQFSPDNQPLRVHIVKELLKACRWKQAFETARSLESTSDHSLFLLAKARHSLLEGRIQEARDAYKEAIQKDRNLIDEGLEAELEESSAAPIKVRTVAGPEEEVEAYADNQMRITFADIGGMESVKEKIRLNILFPLQKPEIYAAYGKKIGGGLLLYGPPGCGKTHLARATAGEIGANFFVLSLNEILSMWLGESEKQLANLFSTARAKAPSVIFIDEIDALGAKRSDMHSASTRAIVSQFLVEMDGMNSNNEKIMILGATNMPWNVDSALRRPGRFDRILFVPPPDKLAREQILGIHTKTRRLESGISLGEIASKTDNFSGADLAHLVEVATERPLTEALRGGEFRDIGMRDFQAALKEVRPSTMEWLRRARSYVNFANQDGMYDELEKYLEKAKIR